MGLTQPSPAVEWLTLWATTETFKPMRSSNNPFLCGAPQCSAAIASGAATFPTTREAFKPMSWEKCARGSTCPSCATGRSTADVPWSRDRNWASRARSPKRAQVELDVTRAAAARYYSWVGAVLKHQFAVKMLGLAVDRDDQIRKRVVAGDLPDIERVDNQRLIAQRRAAVVAAERSMTQNAIELSLFLRDEAGRPRVPTAEEAPEALVPPTPTVASGVNLVERALQARPDLKRTAFALRQVELDVAVQRNQVWPALDFRVIASQDFWRGAAPPARPSS